VVLSASVEFMAKMESYYDSLVDCMTFSKASIELINEIANSIPIFKVIFLKKNQNCK
jgi:hypothetical protein